MVNDNTYSNNVYSNDFCGPRQLLIIGDWTKTLTHDGVTAIRRALIYAELLAEDEVKRWEKDSPMHRYSKHSLASIKTAMKLARAIKDF